MKLQESQMAQLKGGIKNADGSCGVASCGSSCKNDSLILKAVEEKFLNVLKIIYINIIATSILD